MRELLMACVVAGWDAAVALKQGLRPAGVPAEHEQAAQYKPPRCTYCGDRYSPKGATQYERIIQRICLDQQACNDRLAEMHAAYDRGLAEGARRERALAQQARNEVEQPPMPQTEPGGKGE